MNQKLLVFLKKPASLHVVINTLGNYLNVLFTAFFALVLVRIMTPAQYGVLSVLLGIAYVLANVLDFGTTATIYSNLPPLIDLDSNRAYRFIKTTFTFQSILSSIVIFILLLTFPYLDQVFFHTGAPRWELYITAISVLFLIWQNFVLNIFFASKKFMKANIYNNLQNVGKTAILLFLIVTHTLSVGAVIFIFGIVGPIIFFALLFFQQKDLIYILAKTQIAKEDFKFGYTFTYFIATQFYNLGSRMDLFLLSFFSLRNDVGYYGLAQKVILTIVTTVVSITQVLSPNFAKVKTRNEALTELKSGFTYLLIPVGLYLALLITPSALYKLFFTERFGPTIDITKALVPAYVLFTLGSLPLQFILYTAKKPSYVLYSNIIYFIIMTVFCYIYIPKIGVGAPPIANILAIIAPAVILSLATYYEYKKLPIKI